MSLHFLHCRNLQPSSLRPKDAPTERLSLASLAKCRQEPIRLSPSPCFPRSPDGPRPRPEYVSPRRIATLPTIAPRTASGLTPKLVLQTPTLRHSLKSGRSSYLTVT